MHHQKHCNAALRASGIYTRSLWYYRERGVFGVRNQWRVAQQFQTRRRLYWGAFRLRAFTACLCVCMCVRVCVWCTCAYGAGRPEHKKSHRNWPQNTSQLGRPNTHTSALCVGSLKHDTTSTCVVRGFLAKRNTTWEIKLAFTIFLGLLHAKQNISQEFKLTFTVCLGLMHANLNTSQEFKLTFTISMGLLHAI